MKQQIIERTREVRDLRNYFAGQALSALIVSAWVGYSNDPYMKYPKQVLARVAWELADAMLAAEHDGAPT